MFDRGRIRAEPARESPETREASDTVTRAKSYDDNVEECGHFLIQPDPCCPECAAIMVWRSAHRRIAITNRAAIKISGSPWGGRHLHMREMRIARLKNVEGNARNGNAKSPMPPDRVARVVLVANSPRTNSDAREVSGSSFWAPRPFEP